MKNYLTAFSKALRDLFTQKLFYRSATVSYFALILFFPLLTFITFLLSYLPVNPNEISVILERYFPDASTGYLNVVEKLAMKRLSYGIISILLAFIFASNLFVVISNSLAEVTEVQYKSWKHKLLRQFLSVPLFFVLLLVGYVLSLILGVINSYLDISKVLPVWEKVAQYITVSKILSFFSILIFNLFIYTFLLPVKFRKKDLLVVSVVVSVIFMIIKNLFTRGFVIIIKVNPIYGTFSSILGFLLWIYVSSAIILYGGRVLFYLKKQKPALHVPKNEPDKQR